MPCTMSESQQCFAKSCPTDRQQQQRCDISKAISTNFSLMSVVTFNKHVFLMISYFTMLISPTKQSTSTITRDLMYPAISSTNSVVKVNPILLTINEELQIGSQIGRLRELIYPRPNSDVKFVIPQNPYFIVDTGGVLRTHGPVDRDNNRQLCSEPGFPDQCIWSSVAIGTNGQYIAIRITINDVNDNVPTWSEQYITVQVAEELDSKFSTELPIANDPDTGLNGIQEYKLQAEQDFLEYFQLQVSKESTQTSNYRFRLFLHVVAPLDREECPMYNLTLLAFDGSRPFHTGTVTVRVVVIDENDHSPQFTSHSYVAIVQEDAAVQSEVRLLGRNDTDRQSDVGAQYSSPPALQTNDEVFLALDQDSGLNGEIEYSFATSTDPDILKTFSLDRQSGTLRIAKQLSYDNGPREWRFKLYATDHGRPPRSSSTEVSIKLIDANTHAPEIKVRAQLPKAYRVHVQRAQSTGLLSQIDPDLLYIPENMNPINDSLAVVTVSDRDVGPGGTVDCYLTQEQNKAPNFSLFPDRKSPPIMSDYFRLSFTDKLPKWNVYSLFVQKSVDRETMFDRTLIINCTDKGSPPKSSFARLLLYIVDQNDNAPEFTQPTYRIHVLEGNRPNTAIGKLLATDPDEGDNGRITYEITAYSPSNERINETFQVTDTGILIALKSLDRETTPEGYRFKVTATDHGSPKRLSATTDVRVILDDLNDCTPVFTHNQYNFTIIEDYAQNFTGERIVGTVKATDCDIGENGKVAYTILDPGLPFSITKDGILRTSRLIDRELRSVYRFTVLAQDGGGDHSRPERYGLEKFSYERPGDGSGATRSTTDQKYRTSAAQVRITILDLNDNYPVFVYPNSSSLKVHVSVQESREFVVTRLVALDKDSGPNGQVQYRIARANASHGLQIRRTTGELYVEKDMTNTNKGTIELLIEASDQGSPPQKNSIQLHVSVNNMPPVGRNMILVSRPGFADLEKDMGNQSGTIEINKLIMMCIVISTTVICIIMMFVIGLCVRRTSCYRLRHSLGTPCNRTSAVMWRAENGTKGQSENEKRFSNICKKYAICENRQMTCQPMVSRTTSSSPCAMTTESSKLLAEGDTVNTPVDDPVYNGSSEDPTISNNYADALRSEAGNQERLLAKPGFMRIPSDLVSCHTEQNQRVHDPSHRFHPTAVQLSPTQGITTSHPLNVSIDGQMEHDRCLVHVDTSTGVGYLALPMSSSQSQADATSSFIRDKYFVRNPSELISSSHQPHHLDLHVLESDVDSGRGGSVVNIGPPCSNADKVVSNSVADSHLSNLTTPNNSVQSLSPQCMQQSMVDVPINYLPGQLSLITVDGQLCVLAPSNVVSQTNAILVTTADIVNDSQDLSQLDLIQANTPVKTVNTALEPSCTYSQQVTCESQPRSTSANSLSTVVEHKSTTLGSPWRLIDLPP